MRSHFAASRNSAAARSCSAASARSKRLSIAATARCAHSALPMVHPRGFLGVPSCNTASAGASNGVGGVGRAHQKGHVFRVRHALSFPPVHLVIQPVISLISFIEAPMQQLHLPLLCRLDAPSVVHPSLIAQCKSYREAVRLCWQLRRVRNMTRARLAEDAGLYAPHVTCYLNDNERSRDLPGAAVRGFEWACGNTAITQFHMLNTKHTSIEEMQVLRAAA